MTARQAQYAMANYLAGRSLIALNTFPLRWAECDVLEVRKSLLWHECEVKLSMADYLADFHKSVYVWRQGDQPKHELIKGGSGLGPSYFSYAVPEGLFEADQVPEYAGLYLVRPSGYVVVKR